MWTWCDSSPADMFCHGFPASLHLLGPVHVSIAGVFTNALLDISRIKDTISLFVLESITIITPSTVDANVQ